MNLSSDLDQSRLSLRDMSDGDRVRHLARTLIDELGVGVPVDLSMLASARGIARIDEVDLPWAACLINYAGQFLIKVRSTDPRHRRRFSVAHEIGHTFLAGYELTPQFRCAPSANGQRDPIEVLSDIVAGELLMPHSAVGEVLLELGPTIDAANELSDLCDSSFEASARRIVDLSDDAALIVMERRTAPRRPHDEPKLRLNYSHTTGRWPFLPRHKSIATDHPIQRCLEGEVVDATTTLSGLTNEHIDVRVSAIYAPWRDDDGVAHDRVVCIASKS